MNADRKATAPPAEPKRGKLRPYLMLALGTTVLVGLIAAGILYAGDPSRLFSLKAETGDGAGGAKHPGLVNAPAADPNDPTLRFSATHVGQVLFATAGSDKCHRVLFDNRTGVSTWSGDIDCGRPANVAVETEKPNRLLAIKKSFQH